VSDPATLSIAPTALLDFGGGTQIPDESNMILDDAVSLFQGTSDLLLAGRGRGNSYSPIGDLVYYSPDLTAYDTTIIVGGVALRNAVQAEMDSDDIKEGDTVELVNFEFSDYEKVRGVLQEYANALRVNFLVNGQTEEFGDPASFRVAPQ